MWKMVSIVFSALLLAGGVASAQQPAAPPAPQPQAGAGAAPAPGRGMMGSGGMMMGEGGMRCGSLMGQATVQVTRTADGAVLRMVAKDPSNVGAVQQHAEMMARCLNSQSQVP